MKCKVLKGSKNKPEMDSTWPDKAKANDRAKTLRKSLRGKRIEVWIEACEEDDPPNYRKPIAGPYTNYDVRGHHGSSLIKKGYGRPE